MNLSIRPGAKADPNDTRVPELRAYCKGCHVYLEPMARFFYRWPDTGNDSIYFYNHLSAKPLRQQSYKDTGCSDCAPVEGDDVVGFADILAGSGGKLSSGVLSDVRLNLLCAVPPIAKRAQNCCPSMGKFTTIVVKNCGKLWKK